MSVATLVLIIFMPEWHLSHLKHRKESRTVRPFTLFLFFSKKYYYILAKKFQYWSRNVEKITKLIINVTRNADTVGTWYSVSPTVGNFFTGGHGAKEKGTKQRSWQKKLFIFNLKLRFIRKLYWSVDILLFFIIKWEAKYLRLARINSNGPK